MWTVIIFLIRFILGSGAEKCTSLVGPRAYKCIQHLNEIRELSYSIEIYDKDSNSKINKPCSDFKKCHEQLKCGVEDGVVKIIEKLITFCDIVEFHQSEAFEDCDLKLAEKNSTCVGEWNPFPVPVPGDEKKTEEMQKEACKNFFGKDRCLEKELTENCGAKIWIQFKKYYLTLNEINEACELDETGNIRS
ncbi:Protein CBG00773 [Caenorhabditis briggsae]|uniref:Protein CBG00773 n=2 Tax=Caenorhabditis briggsae TaxID=6238 RepID=A8WNS9_CAEBR|nr:Protein CBG00773 [Caenorhabditis briggsae]ULT86373.1 hypothetical protein L3Y34_006215 [Caenorhabditis briggsae]CAP22135.1 Protein CBG00773 [Caenorhabditis briggsae]